MERLSELMSLNDRMQKNGFSFQHQDYLLLRDILPEIVRSVKELEVDGGTMPELNPCPECTKLIEALETIYKYCSLRGDINIYVSFVENYSKQVLEAWNKRDTP